METPTAKTIIDERGGYAVVAAALGVSKSTAHTWWRKNRLPSWRREAVISLAKIETRKHQDAA